VQLQAPLLLLDTSQEMGGADGHSGLHYRPPQQIVLPAFTRNAVAEG